jgi:hypothetical protein
MLTEALDLVSFAPFVDRFFQRKIEKISKTGIAANLLFPDYKHPCSHT